MLLSMICHHSDGERVAGRRDEDSGKWRVEEVGVVGDGVVKAADSKVDQVRVLLVRSDTFLESIVVLLELIYLHFVVVAPEEVLAD